MEPRGCNRWQPVANRLDGRLASASARRRDAEYLRLETPPVRSGVARFAGASRRGRRSRAAPLTLHEVASLGVYVP
jgi:hypothetical protein